MEKKRADADFAAIRKSLCIPAVPRGRRLISLSKATSPKQSPLMSSMTFLSAGRVIDRTRSFQPATPRPSGSQISLPSLRFLQMRFICSSHAVTSHAKNPCCVPIRRTGSTSLPGCMPPLTTSSRMPDNQFNSACSADHRGAACIEKITTGQQNQSEIVANNHQGAGISEYRETEQPGSEQ